MQVFFQSNYLLDGETSSFDGSNHDYAAISGAFGDRLLIYACTNSPTCTTWAYVTEIQSFTGATFGANFFVDDATYPVGTPFKISFISATFISEAFDIAFISLLPALYLALAS